MKYAITLILSIFLLLGCTTGNIPTKDTGSVVEKGLIRNQTIDVGGVIREFHLFIPEKYENAPVVILFHGHSLNNDVLLGLKGEKAPYKVWLQVAEEENIILAVPNGLFVSGNEKGWNDCRADAPTNSLADDVRFIS